MMLGSLAPDDEVDLVTTYTRADKTVLLLSNQIGSFVRSQKRDLKSHKNREFRDSDFIFVF